MREFRLNDEYTVVCESQNTRTGFRHVAILLRNGDEIYRTKCTYQNRTWERFQFESVLNKTITNSFTGAELDEFSAKLATFVRGSILF